MPDLPRWMRYREVQRWLTIRCDLCGHRFRWKRDARHTRQERGGRKVYHQWCIAYLQWRTDAEERLVVIDELDKLYANEIGQDSSRMELAIMGELTAATEDDRVAIANLLFRVFLSLDRMRKARDADQADGA